MFQFTPARSGRQPSGKLTSGPFCFNSRPREAGDDLLSMLRDNIIVSIHARAKRATALSADDLPKLAFQFTPARSGRQGPCGRVGQGRVSIHARAKRATPRRPSCLAVRQFQFTPARSGRLGRLAHVVGVFPFQFTPARSGRRGGTTIRYNLCGFNSRPREAGDP